MTRADARLFPEGKEADGGAAEVARDKWGTSMNPRMTIIATVVSCVLCAGGCTSQPPVRQVLDEKAIIAVQGEIKRQVGIYMAASEIAENDPKDSRDHYWCGSGRIDFVILSVKAELTTTVEAIKTGGIKAKAPFSVIEVDPSGTRKTAVTNTEVLDYTLWPTGEHPGLAAGDLEQAPIAKVLLSLRDALIASTRKTAPGPQACFTDYDPRKPAADPGNSFKLGLSFVSDVTEGFEISVSVLDLTATNEAKGTTGNTLTVTFGQRSAEAIQILRDEMTAQCKFPYIESVQCSIAMNANELLTAPASEVEEHQKALDDEVKELCDEADKKKNKAMEDACGRAQALAELAEELISTGKAFD